MAESLAIDAPLGDGGSLPYVGSSLVAALDALGQLPIAVPARGMQLSACGPAVRRALDRHRALRMRPNPSVQRCLRYAGYRAPRPVRSLRYGALLYWDSDFIPPEFAEVLNQYDELYGVSTFVAGVMAEATGRKVGVIQHGIWPEECPYVPPVTDGPFTFLHLGQVDARKATDLLMRAFVAAFPNGKEDVRLVVKCPAGQGDGARAWHVEHGKEDPRIVVDARNMARRELAAYFHGCHAVVLPSRCEGFGLVGLEALAHGRRVIATGWSGPADYVDAADCVVLSATKIVDAPQYPGHAREVDFEALVEALRAVAGDRDDAERTGLAARARVIERWSWVDRVHEGYLAA